MESTPIAPTVEELKANIRQEVLLLIEWVLSCQSLTFFAFETQLIPRALALGRLFVQLFLCMRQEQFRAMHPQPQAGYKRIKGRVRQLRTFFGKIGYWRTYFYRRGGGYYPLDIELGLTGDGFSMWIQSLAARIATKMSYAQAVVVLTMFLGWSPAQDSIETMVLGLGRHTGVWFEAAPAPEGDGEVLVIQVDSKATPTATEEELEKRRGPRRENPHPGSQRHRGRAARQRRGSKKRRKKGDKAKNGKMATIVIMYTLKQSTDGTLEGPINKKAYASYAPKRHAMAIARREADKRGFGQGSGKLIQIVTDGDNDLERYIEEYFPEAEHTIDVFHATEYLWEAGRCLYKEGSDELVEWAEAQKELLYDGRAAEIVTEIDKYLAQLDPGKQITRERLQKVREYINKRMDKMNYKQLRERDLEISSGAVEGAVNYVIAKRFDSNGMRWIKERAEHLLQLRCIEVNGDWDAFIQFVHDRTREQAQQHRKNLSLKRTKPAPLPTYGLA
ncbi:MAG: hypothetical protein ACYS76_16110 [Planctomycetota bacterium]|jgi:hypothetical protein